MSLSMAGLTMPSVSDPGAVPTVIVEPISRSAGALAPPGSER
jgi:hypothetical protein